MESSAEQVASRSRWIGGSWPLPSSVVVGACAFALSTNRDRHPAAFDGATRGVAPVGEAPSDCDGILSLSHTQTPTRPLPDGSICSAERGVVAGISRQNWPSLVKAAPGGEAGNTRLKTSAAALPLMADTRPTARRSSRFGATRRAEGPPGPLASACPRPPARAAAWHGPRAWSACAPAGSSPRAAPEGPDAMASAAGSGAELESSERCGELLVRSERLQGGTLRGPGPRRQPLLCSQSQRAALRCPSGEGGSSPRWQARRRV